MATGKFTPLDIAVQKIGGPVDLAVDSFNVVLTYYNQGLFPGFVGASNNAQYSDLTHEITGPGYVALGAPLLNRTWTRVADTSVWRADPTAWSGLNDIIKYGIIIKNTGFRDIIGYVDFDEDLVTGRVITGDLIITWADGILDMKRIA